VTIGEALAGFPFARGVEVEIGCGNGHFICEYAARRPDVLMVGIEVKKKRVLAARKKADLRGLRNVAIIDAGAEGVIAGTPDRSVDAFHLYFPDPWPKARHRKRRFFVLSNLTQMHRCLVPGGRVWFLTDFHDYYVQAKVLLLAHGGFRLVPDAAPVEASLSVFNRMFANVEKPVHLVCAARSDGDVSPEAAPGTGTSPSG
jgi:tRNA (guanine-N(7)-)-methyltransferase